MKNGWKIYSSDMKNITRNWVAAILIGGIIILPSLYAWFNIKASWDPYSQTDQIPIGVVNEDAGGQVRDEKINVGDDLVNALKDNDSMDWHFTNREKAMQNLKYGNYFAVIIIPEKFSNKLSTVITDNPEKSRMEYYVNEKINAISPKITDKGASTIVEQVSSNFISTVNGVIFDMFDEIGVELNKNLPDIKKFEDYVFKMEEKLPEIHELVSGGLQDTKDAQSIINKAQNMLPEAERTTNNGLATVNETTDLLSKAESRLNEMAPKIEKDLKKAQETAEDINKLLKDARNTNIDFSKGKELQQSIDSSLNDAISRIDEIEKTLKQLKEMNQKQQNGSGDAGSEDSTGLENNGPNNGSNQDQVIDDAIERLQTLRGALEEGRQNGQNITAFIEDKKQEVDSVITDLEGLSGNTANRIGDFLTDYKENIEPTVKQKINNAQQTLSDAEGVLSEIKSTIPEVKRVLSNTEDHIGEGQEMLNTILGEYPYVNSKVNELADKIRDIQGETDINEIIELLRNDPEAERSFFEEPVKLSKNELFPIPNYGSGMTPFYTVLAIWVGGLLLISLLAADVHGGEELTGRERYIGKLFTFLTIGLLQTLIVTLGDRFIVDAYMVHPVWFVIFGLLISLVFMLIIFTLVSLFGDVGKAMVIVLLVLQIAGAGGTYPVALLPEFFQAINPFLPFTYAIDLMREAVGGIIWKSAIHDMAVLGLFGLGFLLFGVLFKNVVNKYTDRLMKKSKEAGLFH
ncbi:MAG TPA: YhgE/Pip domain-containing protein [Lentibacillus sp.]|uniref:YhgE/Pip domain-containing protein n=1 Tax=Lentibacillus sp. TaxID=1925746 RepID=UPI002B4AB73A|nr:YhgE/Pip domain-containing protein [Lentibacillus sp.]HLR62070.1 YhgE/Pip domain-containing protein [Lentibacillus sp.]